VIITLELDFLFFGPSNTGPFYLYSLIILDREQHSSFIKKNSQTLGLRGIPTRRGNPSHFVVPKPTGAIRHITLCGHGR